MYKKFILFFKTLDFNDVDLSLILGNVNNHTELEPNNSDISQVYGGGFFKIENDTIIFYGESETYGKAPKEEIELAIKNNLITLDNKDISKKYKFVIE